MINILYLNFWNGFDPYNNKFTYLLKQKYNVNIITKDDNIIPDLLIYSCFIKDNIYEYNCPKLYISGENDVPDFNICDYAISAAKLEFGKRHLYIPYFGLLTNDYKRLWNTDRVFHSDLYNRKFCSCVVGNISQADPKRREIIYAVNTIRQVAFGGSFMNNIGGNVKDKLDFISQYKFNIATENSNVNGYITEKIVDAFIANTIPIYWGTDSVKQIFNPDSFINVNDYNSMESLKQEIIRLCNDNDAYMKMVQAGSLLSNISLQFNEQIAAFLYNIIDNLHVKYTTDYGRAAIINHNIELLFKYNNGQT